MRHVLIVVAALALCAGVLASPASAQRRYRSPSGPTITPYLDYFRRDNGVLRDPYNAWVRPRRIVRDEIYQQRQSLYTLGRGLRDVNRDVNQMQSLRASGASPTGTGSSFMNYSHYYQMRSGRRR